MTKSSDTTTVLRGATIVDTRDGSLEPGRDITIANGRIVEITATVHTTRHGASSVADDDSTANAATVVDATGKYIVPGYLDMHAHPLGPGDPSGSLALMLANGITGFRQMSGAAHLLQLRSAGALRLPEDSPALLLTPGEILTPVNAGTPETAVATVRAQAAAGADFIKVGFLTPEVFFAAQDEARRLGIPIVGHLPTGIDVWAASRGGMKSIEHLGPGVGILAGCSSDEAEILATLAAAPPTAPPAPERFEEYLRELIVNPVLSSDTTTNDVLRRAVDTFSEEKAERLAARFVEDGTWQVPTLIRKLTTELSDAPEFRADPDLRYVAESTLQEWYAAADKFAAMPETDRQTQRDAYALQLRLTALFDKAGVKILAGSDSCGAGWEVPGFALHHEFDLLAEAGLSPLRVLQTVTLDAAEFLDATDTLGRVVKGRPADLVLLDADPVASAENLHTIDGVVRDGRYYSSEALNALKERVAAARSVH